MTKRTFVAIPIQINECLNEIFHSLRERFAHDKIRWADTGQLHLTLTFLGETKEEDIYNMHQYLLTRTKELPILKIHIKGPGYFGKPTAPKVIWFGINVPNEIRSLKEDFDSFAGSLGYRLEKRAFKPHLTVGRVKSMQQPEELVSLIKSFDAKDVQQEVIVNKIIFFESQLNPSGVIHRPIHGYSLNK